MMRVVELMLLLLVLTVCFWLLLQVDAEDAHAVSVDVFGDGGVYDAMDDVVADGDEADGDIRISGIKTTCAKASDRPAATRTATLRA